MSKFADPPVQSDFETKGTPLPSYPWEQWFQAVANQLTASPQGFSVTHANRLKLTSQGIGSLAFETDTGHVLAWSGKAWIQLI